MEMVTLGKTGLRVSRLGVGLVEIGVQLSEGETELAGRVTIAKMNVDENPQTPSKFGVRGIPTLMLFKGGEVASTKIGALPKGKIKAWIEAAI